MSSATTTPTKTMMTPPNYHPTMPLQQQQQHHSASTHSTPVRSSQQQPSPHSASTSSLPANDLDVIQDMIDCSANRLEGLRTQCVTSTTLTQREIRSLETKLLRMFSELLLTKGRLNERLPASGLPHTSGNELRQWLRVVGLCQDSLNVCLTRLSTLEQILELSDKQLKELIQNNPTYREEEVRRLTKAMHNLRKCKDLLARPNESSLEQQQQQKSDDDGSERHMTTDDLSFAASTKESKEQMIEQLFWDSWDRPHRGSVGNIGITASPRSHRSIMKQAKQHQQQQQQANRQSPSNDTQHSYKSSSTSVINSGEDNSISNLTLTLTPSPPHSPFTPTSTSTSFSQMGGGSLNGTPQKGKIAGTPPPMIKHYTAFNNAQPLTPTHQAYGSGGSGGGGYQQQDHIPIPLSKSKSNESQFQDTSLSSFPTVTSSPSSMANNTYKPSGGGGGAGITRSRLNTDPSPDNNSSASSDNLMESSTNSSNNNSLQVPLSPCTPIVNLSMSHNIAHRFTTLVKMATCDHCQKPMFIGRKCKECKYRCHKMCEPDVPNSCCLPPEFIDEFKQAIKDQMAGGGYHSQHSHNTPPNLNNQSPQQSHHSTLGKVRKVLTSGRHQKHSSNASSTIGVHADSSSPGSSCNSSSPSSPALFNIHHIHHSSGDMQGVGANIMSSSAGGSSTSSNMLSTPSSHKNASQFNFPDVTITSNCNNPSGATTETILSAQNANNTSPNHEFTPDTQQQKSRNNSHEALISSNNANTQHNSNTTSGNSGGINVLINSSNNFTSSTSSTLTNNSVNSMANTGTASFFPRRLSSAGGVDKRSNLTDLSDTHKSNDSDKTVSLSGSTSASTDSDRTPVRLDSTEDGDSGNWPRQNSLSLKEWDIPYGDLQMLEKIGQGRFGTVHRALWHGSVAVKLLKEDYLDDEHMLEAFKVEVANFKKTRHENLVLFMGACMNPPYLAIVTSLCKGNTLYTHIHTRKEKFVINKTTLIAQQITQGMGYLHARGIIHKDLRTKNIFLENGKVIITDFGLFSSTKLLYCDKGLGVPTGWLCYLAPELMRCLMPHKPPDEILPFSAASDVYSFGTVWYELLCGEFPFKSQPPESIIWQVGRGMKQTLANLQTSRDVKDILMLCWHYAADDNSRPDFPKLLTLFERLPKKRLARSPSHPIQLSRSAEAIF